MSMDTVHNVLIYGTYIFLFLVSAFLVMITLGTESSPHKEKQTVQRMRKRNRTKNCVSRKAYLHIRQIQREIPRHRSFGVW